MLANCPKIVKEELSSKLKLKRRAITSFAGLVARYDISAPQT